MATTVPQLSRSELAEALKREPLVNVNVASRMLGIFSSNFRRDGAPHLTAIAVEGKGDVYFRSEVLELARERAERRAHTNGA